MKNAKISRRSFLLGLAACSAAGILTACKGADTPASSASTSPEAPASSVSELEPIGLFTVEDFPKLDGSTACIPLMAQMMADTTGIDLEVAQSGISVSTTAYAWENFGLYPDEDYTAKMLVVYEAPDYVKEELQEAGAQLEQKPIGRDALVFIVNENNPVKSLTRQQLKDIYAGKITNWKEVGGADAAITVINRASGSGTRATFEAAVLGDTKVPDTFKPQEQDSSGTAAKMVASTPGAISYLAFSYYDDTVKALKVGGVEPKEANVEDNSWTIWAYEHMYTAADPDEATKAFIEYMMSDDVQGELVEAQGYIPVSGMKVEKDASGKVTKK